MFKFIKLQFPNRFTLLLLSLCLAGGLHAQKTFKVMFTPPSLHNIQDDNYWQGNYSEIISLAATRGEVKGMPWMVVCDRAGVEARQQPNGTVVKKLEFKEGPFYVLSQTEDWVEIVKGRPVGKDGSNKIEGAYVGWVPKREMLMWSEGLRAPSGIQKYVFILLRAADIRQLGTLGANKAKLFNTPEPGIQSSDTIRIFSFYNVLKREGSRYLIASLDDGRLPGIEAQISNSIIGWVEVENTTPWNTRVVLEPNFSDEGYAERKGNPNFQLYGYEEARQAGLHARNGQYTKEGIKWEKDPVEVSADELAKSNGRRYLGGVMRFPMLSRGAVTRNSPTFKSGVIGDVKLKDETKANDGKIAAVCNVLERTANNLNNVNIMFAVQGTSNMAPYKQDIVNAARDIGEAYAGTAANIRYGGVVYHNITDEKGGEESLVNLHELSSSRQAFLDFLEGASFDNKESDDNTNIPAAAYGIDRLLKKVNLNQDHSNILILIGSDGDYQSNDLLKKQFSGHRAAVPANKIMESIAASNTQLFSVAISVKGRMGKKFIDLAHYLTSNSAVSVYNDTYASLSGDYIKVVGKPKEPHLDIVPDQLDRETKIFIADSPTPGGIILPADGTSITNLSAIIQDIGERNKLHIKINNELYSNYCIRGIKFGVEPGGGTFDNVSAGGFTAIVQNKLARILKEVNISADQLGDRFQLYEEVHFPRQINGTTKPTMSFVLFMGDFEVLKYIQDVEEIINTASRQSSDKQREAIVDLYASLYGFFTGETDREVLYDKTIEQITSLMFGMRDEGLECPEEAEYYCSLKLKDVTDETAISDSEVEKILTHFKQVADRLENDVLAADNEFRFKARTGESYYWVPLVDIY